MQVSYKMVQNLIKLLIIVVAIVLVILILIDKNNFGSNSGAKASTVTSSASTNNKAASTSPYAVLSPATVAPKVAECNQAVSYSSAGVPSPIQCSNGSLNVAAWNALSAQEPKVMLLGYSPSQSDVQSAVCSDIHAASSDSAPGADNAIESEALQISALYYGWGFAGSAGSYIANC